METQAAKRRGKRRSSDRLKQQDQIDMTKDAEIIALIAYLQRMGTDINKVADLNQE